MSIVRLAPGVLGFVALAAIWSSPARAQVPNHLECFKMKDTLRLGGTADLNTQLGLAPGCLVRKAALFCVSATATNLAVTNMQSGDPIVPLPIGSGASGAREEGRVCYKVKCPESAIADQSVTDPFGNRTVSKLKASLVCAPAFTGTARFVDNGNSVTDNYTGLQWVKTCCLDGVPDASNPQDADNTYTWGLFDGCPFEGCPNGSAFTDYLARLNLCTTELSNQPPVFAGFAGHCDWRLPTIAELRTLLGTQDTPPCGGGVVPCITPAVGPTTAGDYWSATTLVDGAIFAWYVNFSEVRVSAASKRSYPGGPLYVRAVRGGSGI